jgi:hypothetical protein
MAIKRSGFTGPPDRISLSRKLFMLPGFLLSPNENAARLKSHYPRNRAGKVQQSRSKSDHILDSNFASLWFAYSVSVLQTRALGGLVHASKPCFPLVISIYNSYNHIKLLPRFFVWLAGSKHLTKASLTWPRKYLQQWMLSDKDTQFI